MGRRKTPIVIKKRRAMLGKAFAIFMSHPTLFLYLLMVCYGAIYQYKKYEIFDINILYFMRAEDYLFSFFNDPNIFIISFCSLFLSILFLICFNAEDYNEKKSKKNFKKILTKIKFYIKSQSFLQSFIIFLIISIGAVWIGGDKAAKKILKNPEKNKIYFKEEEKTFGKNTSELSLIGSTSKMIFFWDSNEKKTLIIPLENILKIEVLNQNK